jgi:glutamate formiminotransferase
LKGLALEDCVALAHNVGRRIANELGIPVYFYGAAALRPDRVKLEDVRRGQFEGLSEAVATDERKAPDLGGPHLHPTAGAVIVGARKLLIAFNVNLQSESLPLAKSIAKRIRERDGGFPGVKALGLSLPTRGLVQVSMNITDFEAAPLHVVYAEIVRLAAEAGVPVFESELIGLMPRQALEMAAAGFLQMSNFQTTSVIENQLEAKLREP